MDFSFSEEQQSLEALADRIFGDLVSAETIPSFEEPKDWQDERLWGELAKAQLLGVCLAEDVGGMGLGLTEACILLLAAGRAIAPVPLWPTLLLGAAPIDRFGSAALRSEILPRVLRGEAVLSAALSENPGDASARVGGSPGSSGWRLDGRRDFVPAARLARRILVPADCGEAGLAVFAVDPSWDGVRLEPQATTTGELQYRMELSSVEVDEKELLGSLGQGSEILDWITQRAVAGLCAVELGVAETSLRRTAEYTAERKQFGKAIATFQAVAQRAADAYIDVEAIRLATWQAIWRLDAGLPAVRELAIAKFWACEGGHRACYAAQHLHGGIGVDTDYPLHHHYLLSKQIELTLGGANTQLERLGRLLAGVDEQSHA